MCLLTSEKDASEGEDPKPDNRIRKTPLKLSKLWISPKDTLSEEKEEKQNLSISQVSEA